MGSLVNYIGKNNRIYPQPLPLEKHNVPIHQTWCLEPQAAQSPLQPVPWGCVWIQVKKLSTQCLLNIFQAPKAFSVPILLMEPSCFPDTCHLPRVTSFTTRLCRLQSTCASGSSPVTPPHALPHLFRGSLRALGRVPLSYTCLCALHILPNGLKVTQLRLLPPHPTPYVTDCGRDFQSPYSTCILPSSLATGP